MLKHPSDRHQVEKSPRGMQTIMECQLILFAIQDQLPNTGATTGCGQGTMIGRSDGRTILFPEIHKVSSIHYKMRGCAGVEDCSCGGCEATDIQNLSDHCTRQLSAKFGGSGCRGRIMCRVLRRSCGCDVQSCCHSFVLGVLFLGCLLRIQAGTLLSIPPPGQ